MCHCGLRKQFKCIFVHGYTDYNERKHWKISGKIEEENLKKDKLSADENIMIYNFSEEMFSERLTGRVFYPPVLSKSGSKKSILLRSSPLEVLYKKSALKCFFKFTCKINKQKKHL